MSYDEIPPIIEENLEPVTRRRDYAPRGYKPWARYQGSHIGVKQYTKMMKKLIADMTPETRLERFNELNTIDPQFNKQLHPRKVIIALELLRESLGLPVPPNETSN